jgi:hypothetical protein
MFSISLFIIRFFQTRYISFLSILKELYVIISSIILSCLKKRNRINCVDIYTLKQIAGMVHK